MRLIGIAVFVIGCLLLLAGDWLVGGETLEEDPDYS